MTDEAPLPQVTGSTHPLATAALRVLAGVFAALVVAVWLFGESLAYAMAVGLAAGVAFATVGYLRDRLGDDRFGHS